LRVSFSGWYGLSLLRLAEDREAGENVGCQLHPQDSGCDPDDDERRRKKELFAQKEVSAKNNHKYNCCERQKCR
jgi:hypothetical protein